MTLGKSASLCLFPGCFRGALRDPAFPSSKQKHKGLSNSVSCAHLRLNAEQHLPVTKPTAHAPCQGNTGLWGTASLLENCRGWSFGATFTRPTRLQNSLRQLSAHCCPAQAQLALCEKQEELPCCWLHFLFRGSVLCRDSVIWSGCAVSGLHGL